MNLKLNLFAAALIVAGGLSMTRPAHATMVDVRLRSCCSTMDQKQYCCFYGGDGCRITSTGCVKV